MNASSRRTLRLGITAGLSLGAIVGLVGCAEQNDQVDGQDSAGITYNGIGYNGVTFNGLTFNGLTYNGIGFNGLGYNGLTFNGLTYNGLGYNGLTYNGITFNGLETAGGLSSTSGLMTTEAGREVVKYMVQIGYPNGASLTAKDQYSHSYTFQGSLGVAPEIESGICDANCQEKMTGALLAHVNNSGLHVAIWLVGPDSGIGWGSSPDFPYQEGTYFGNLFANNMPGNYCGGRDLSAADAKGRLGSPFGNNSAVMNSPYGWQWDGINSQNVPTYCSSAGNNYCTAQNEGFSSCNDLSGNPNHTKWNHPVTVYRNFESTMIYKICNKYNKCLGVVGGSMAAGADIEQRAYAAAAGQTWQVVQVSTGNYKVINKTSGLALTVTGTQVEQQPYMGLSNQIVPMQYMASDRGLVNLRMTSNPSAMFMPANNNDGTLVQTTTSYPLDSGSPESARWYFQSLGPASVDPGIPYRLVPQSAPGSSIDIAGGSTANGTTVQQNSTSNLDGQKLVVTDAGKGRVKLTMKTNKNKCVGPKGGATTPGTKLEVQDCNSADNQAWISGETAAGSGVFMMKNVANPAVCLDVTGGSTANGAAMEVYTCNGNNNQLFAARPAP
jgi:hypothetical protein